MDDTLSINIKIDNRTYPLTVDRKDEEKYRNAAKMVNELIQAFRIEYPDKNSLDVLSMAAFQIGFNSLVIKENADRPFLISDLKDIRDDIVDFLEEKSGRRF
jgi:cell division protein ZapA